MRNAPAGAAAVSELVARARDVVVLSGAGLSAECGMPTFRGPDGLWNSFKVEELATPEAFEENPERVWTWYSERRAKAATLVPHAGHEALVRMEGQRSRRVTHVTQNIDGLLQKAGCLRVLELHGSLTRIRCSGGCAGEREDHRHPFPHPEPCLGCGALMRPAVVWFGELLPTAVLEESTRAVQEADLLLVVGTSSLVHPAAGLAQVALQGGTPLVEINPEPTPLTALATHAISASASVALSAILLP